MSTEPLRRLRLDIAYDGTDFHGWAHQQGLRTVQGLIEEKLSLVLRHPVELSVAGRTDAGVHATGQVAHCDIPASTLNQRSIGGEPAALVRRLRKLLDDDIRILAVSFAPPGFDARFSALRRHYRYRITTSPSGALPTRRVDTATWTRPVDLAAMNDAAAALIGLHDFAAFCRHKPHATTIRDLQEFYWEDVSTAAQPQCYEATVVADAFCWSMVRSLVGCCLAVGQGQRDVDFAAALLQTTERSSLIPVAPAHGLTLEQVDYPAAEYLATRAADTRARRSQPPVLS